jgi:dihydroxy-acid dehydratase
MTKEAFENAITVMLALGGSTNGVSMPFLFLVILLPLYIYFILYSFTCFILFFDENFYVLHLLALAREAEVNLTIADFNRVGSKVPLIGNFKPFGQYLQI